MFRRRQTSRAATLILEVGGLILGKDRRLGEGLRGGGRGPEGWGRADTGLGADAGGMSDAGRACAGERGLVLGRGLTLGEGLMMMLGADGGLG